MALLSHYHKLHDMVTVTVTGDKVAIEESRRLQKNDVIQYV